MSGFSSSELRLNSCCPCKFALRIGETRFLVLLLMLQSCHRLFTAFLMCAWILVLKYESGLWRRWASASRSELGSCDLILANLSANSLPLCPSCPGTHSTVMNLLVEMSLRHSWARNIVLLLMWLR